MQQTASLHEEIKDLLKRATAESDNDYALAILTLHKAYSLMDFCQTEWPIETYFRLSRYMHLSDRYHEAIDWLQNLHDTVDTKSDEREVLYKKWGIRTNRNRFAKIKKSERNTKRKIIKREIELYQKRQQKIEEKKSKSGAISPNKSLEPDIHSIERKAIDIRAEKVSETIYNFLQQCFYRFESDKKIDKSTETSFFSNPLKKQISIFDVYHMSLSEKVFIRELFSQYVTFLELNRDLNFPSGFLDDSTKEKIGEQLLAYMRHYKWPFPQTVSYK